jgi:dihydrofolate reductase
MDKKKKIGLFLSLAVLAAGIFGVKSAQKKPAENQPLSPLDNKVSSNGRAEITAQENCPALFSQSADEYLASASEKSDDDCFIAGCGGSL